MTGRATAPTTAAAESCGPRAGATPAGGFDTVGVFASARAGDFAGAATGAFGSIRNGAFAGTEGFTTACAGDFVPAPTDTVTRDSGSTRVGDFAGTDTDTGGFDVVCGGDFASAFAGDFDGVSAESFVGDFEGVSAESLVGDFEGVSAESLVGDFEGDFDEDDDPDSEDVCEDFCEDVDEPDLSLFSVTDLTAFSAADVTCLTALPPEPPSCDPPPLELLATWPLSACATPVANPSRRKPTRKPTVRTSRRATRSSACRRGGVGAPAGGSGAAVVMAMRSPPVSSSDGWLLPRRQRNAEYPDLQCGERQ